MIARDGWNQNSIIARIFETTLGDMSGRENKDRMERYLIACKDLTDMVMKGPDECGSYEDFYYVFGSSEKTLSIIKKAVLENQKMCQICGSYNDLCVHHIIPTSMGGGDSPKNLAVVCRKCHHLIHRDAHRQHGDVIRYMAFKKQRDEHLKDSKPGWREIENTLTCQYQTTSKIVKETLQPYSRVLPYLKTMERQGKVISVVVAGSRDSNAQLAWKLSLMEEYE